MKAMGNQFVKSESLRAYLVVLVVTLMFAGWLTWSATAADVQALHTVKHTSIALSTDKSFNILLPAGYTTALEYPTIYVLHGASGGYTDWINMSHIRHYAEQYSAILVFPDGGRYGWYVDSPLEPQSQYESYIIQELIPYVDANFATAATGEKRAIVGLSMGGHGAITLAIKHPGTFRSASSLSGILDITTHPNQWQIAARLGALSTNRQVWEANSALHLANQLGSQPQLNIKFDCGTSDTYAINDNRTFHNKLSDLGIVHEYHEYPGKHNWEYWDTHIEQHLRFHMQAMDVLPTL